MKTEEVPSMHRRPLAIRGKKWPNRIASALSSVGISPNAISTVSVLFGLATFWYLVFPPHANPRLNLGLAALMIQMRLICNLLDGLVAVEGGKKTATGGLFNEVPDRFCDAFTLIGLGYACQENPMALELGYLATVLAFFTAYIRVLGASLGTASYFDGPQAKQQRMAVVTVALVLSALSSWKIFMLLALWIVVLGSAWTCLRRLRMIAQELNATKGSEQPEE